MSAVAEDKERQIVPRWRFTHQLWFSPEFEGDPRTQRRVTFDRSHLEQKLADWHHARNIGTAIDLVGCGVGGGWIDHVRPAADYLRRSNEILTPQTISLVEQALTGSGARPRDVKLECQEFTPDKLTFEQARSQVATARQKIQRDPRNTLAWLDLARGQAILGNQGKATLATERALYLTPYHRHTLRSAARYFIHSGEYDRAHSLLTRNPRTRTDPWLMAAEISVAKIAQRKPRFAKAAKRLIEAEQLPPKHLTELHSAMGTLEYYVGAERRARKHLRASLIAPNDNTVAQARWIRTKLPGILIDNQAFGLPLSFEARCWHALETRRWNDARMECFNWLHDEPFSSRPAQLGSYIGVSLTIDHDFAEASARAGIRADPNNTSLRNNLAVALAYQGKLDEAIEHFAKIALPLPTNFRSYVFLATTGLLHFRMGDIATGRNFYDMAEREAPSAEKGRVAVFRAREELNVHSDKAFEHVERARRLSKTAKSEFSKRLLQLLEQQAQVKQLPYTRVSDGTSLTGVRRQLARVVKNSDALVSRVNSVLVSSDKSVTRKNNSVARKENCSTRIRDAALQADR